jgi:hypothetical protein
VKGETQTKEAARPFTRSNEAKKKKKKKKKLKKKKKQKKKKIKNWKTKYN